MAVFSGTNIVNDGLVFHFDLQNSVKSWKGKPSLNLITDPFALNGAPSPLYMSETSYESIKTRESVLPNAEMYDISPFWYKSVKDVSNNGRVFFLQISGLEINTNYCFSFYAYTDDTRVSSIRATSDNTNNSPLVSQTNYNMTKRGQIQRVYCIFKSTAGGQTIGVRVGSSDSIGSTFWYTGIQVEKGSFPTRVINGVRLDTATIVDVKKLKTITAQNLTYRQDDTPTFDGTDDYMSLNSSVDIYQKSFSVTAWIKRAQTGAGHGIVGDRQYYWFAFMVDSNDRLSSRFGYYNESNIATRNDVFSDTGAIGTEWTYVGLTFENGVGSKLYINGENVASNENPNAFGLSASNRGPQYIGRADYSGFGTSPNFFEGEIDQVKIYSDKTLTEAEIKQNFEATRSRYGI